MNPSILLMCALGGGLGVLVGILPGLGPSATIAILLPLVFGRQPLITMVMLAGIYYGSQFGGSITSISLNVPGEASSVPTCFDGYPLTKKGKAGKAMGVAVLSSFVGGTIGVIILTFMAKPIATFALRFGPPEYFTIYLFTFVAIISLAKGNRFKGFVSLILGLFFTTIGMDRYSVVSRLNFGTFELMRGINIIPVAVGLMGLSEIILSIAEGETIEIKKDDPSLKFKLKDVFPTIKEFIFCLPTMIRSTIMGFFIGVLPGAGASIASNLSYDMEKQIASDKKNFGEGSLQGVAAPEAANNACISGAFVTMLSLGIPGSNSTAMLLGALIILGIQPGPGLVTRSPDIFWGLISSMYVGNILIVIMCLTLIPIFLFFLRVSQKTIPVIVATICVIGTYGSENAMFDVGVMFFFAIIGMFLKSLKFPVAPIVITLVLGSEFVPANHGFVQKQSGTLSHPPYRLGLSFPVRCSNRCAHYIMADKRTEKEEKPGCAGLIGSLFNKFGLGF